MIAYGALSLAACFLLSGTPRLAVLILFAYFAVRTLISQFRPKD